MGGCDDLINDIRATLTVPLSLEGPRLLWGQKGGSLSPPGPGVPPAGGVPCPPFPDQPPVPHQQHQPNEIPEWVHHVTNHPTVPKFITGVMAGVGPQNTHPRSPGGGCNSAPARERGAVSECPPALRHPFVVSPPQAPSDRPLRTRRPPPPPAVTSGFNLCRFWRRAGGVRRVRVSSRGAGDSGGTRNSPGSHWEVTGSHQLRREKLERVSGGDTSGDTPPPRGVFWVRSGLW